MSGVIPSTACMPPGETRKPVTTSSKTSTVPVAVHAARAAAMNDRVERQLAVVRAGRLHDHGGDVTAGERPPRGRLDRRSGPPW